MKFGTLTHCVALMAELGWNKVAFRGRDSYQSSLASYFSQQESSIQPACIVQPKTPEDVATAVRILANSGAKFAIRSGGHAVYAGAANIGETGATIDLRALNSIKLSNDNNTASVGPGATWGDVYSKLDPLGLSVVGGRGGHVGVGGLSTGGGISYFSPRFGWTCDTVSNYEIVLASGEIANANDKENPDLLRALRGGSNNFGVVTRIDLNTFPQGNLWGGMAISTIETLPQQLKAFENFSAVKAYDEYSSLITTFIYSGAQGASFIVNSMEYTKPTPNPPTFQELLAIPSFTSTLRVSNMTDISREQIAGSPTGLRQSYLSITTGITADMLNATYQRWYEGSLAVKDVKDILWNLSLEPIPAAIYKKGTYNSLGMNTRSKPLVISLLSTQWTQTADDAKVEGAVRTMFDALTTDAKRLGQDDPFVYLNYAAPPQNVITGYGLESVEHLQKVRARVDPKGVFSKQVPGGFKIPA